jgi:hypothetical protein
MKYRKKPVVVEAIQYKDPHDYDNIDDIKNFTNGSIKVESGIGSSEDGGGYPQRYTQVKIPTLEGEMLVSEGDYIIKGVNGEFYPCKPDIFHKTYEKVQ